MKYKSYSEKYLNEISENGVLTSGSLLKRVTERLLSSVQDFYDELELNFKPVWFPILLALKHNGTLDAKTIAEKRKVSKSAISQLLKEMKKEGLINIEPSKVDQRHKEISLSDHGLETSEQLIKPLRLIEETLEDIFGDNWQTFHDTLIKIDDEIRAKPFAMRRLKPLQEIKIISYNPKYKEDFKTINLEWIEKYFKYEKNDEKFLDNPEKEIINKGDEILFALHKGKAIGTLALTHRSKKAIEIIRMAVLEEFQGREVASKLLEKSVKHAQEKGYSEIFLGTSNSLKPAMNFYTKHGFKEVDYEGSKLARVNIQMSLKI